jgi:hypothetical protein
MSQKSQGGEDVMLVALKMEIVCVSETLVSKS